MEDKGYKIALEEAKGDKNLVHKNAGWYCENGLEIEYDTEGRPIR